MPFNQQMSFPVRLRLRQTSDGLRMFATPVHEIRKLHDQTHRWENVTLEPGIDHAPRGAVGQLLHIRAELTIEEAETVGLHVGEATVTYDAENQRLSCGDVSAPLKTWGGSIELELLVDRGSIEIFTNDGRRAMSIGVSPLGEDRAGHAFATGGAARLDSLVVRELESAWR